MTEIAVCVNGHIGEWDGGLCEKCGPDYVVGRYVPKEDYDRDINSLEDHIRELEAARDAAVVKAQERTKYANEEYQRRQEAEAIAEDLAEQLEDARAVATTSAQVNELKDELVWVYRGLNNARMEIDKHRVNEIHRLQHLAGEEFGVSRDESPACDCGRESGHCGLCH